MQFDYRNTPDGQIENPVIPAGTYEIKVIGVKEMISQSSGHEIWIIKSEVTSGEYKGSKIDDFNVFSPSLDSANKAMLMVFGFDVDKQVMNIEPENLIGRQVLVTIYIDTYNGKQRNKVERFGGYQPLDEIRQQEQAIANASPNNISEDPIPF